ncbi:hypothetical protein FEM48_Zijuj03G0052400 [Ziziphus jujuba var. spinosa]|uniref:NAC domain-containing protein n=1 Tax=Ziziphus jujuba var. spinosa TaxID=714518 RepID=A0A978VND8_ZIZJJ|nr:hypothetical protein FEM48_Zijuj03G0052400 [Ziziphus jujuba var. spinosa]
MGRDSATSLAPGFRFHPTDEELVRYYLKRKVSGRPLRFDHISVVDVYKSEPWDLPGQSKLKTRDLEWYFFSVLDKKYGNGSRTNRATEKGYWKTTGKDRPISYNSRNVGMKKTLVYHSGRAPKGARSNWVMHEYRLVDEELEKAGIAQDAYVLCRIFQKSGTGPKNGEQYGAPFIEEEWEDDELTWVPGEEAPIDEVQVSNGEYVEPNMVDQNLDAGIPSENAPVPLNFYYADTSNNVEHSGDFVQDDVKPIIGTGETSQVGGEQVFFDLPQQYGMGAEPVKDEYPVDINYSNNEPYLDASEAPSFGDDFYIETNDLTKPIDPEDFDMLDEYLTFFDVDDDNTQYLTIDSSANVGIENNVSESDPNGQKLVNGETEFLASGSQHLLEANDSSEASSSKQKPEATEFEPDMKSSFIKRASHMLGSIPAPPAFASEFPTKEAALQLNSAAQSSSSVHMIRIRNMTLDGSGMDLSFGKNEDVNLVLSFGVSHADANSITLVPVARLLYGKTGSTFTRGCFFFLFIWVLILSVSFKIGSHFYTK